MKKMTAILSHIFNMIALWAESCKKDDESRIIPVGGQAVIEGVLMKGPEHWGLVVREPSGNLWTKAWLGSEWLKKKPWTIPVLRGFASMVEMLRIGMRALSLSAERALGEDDSFTWKELAISIFFSAVLALTLTPALCATLLKPHGEPGEYKEPRGGWRGWPQRFFNGFNDRFERGRERYVGGVAAMLGRPARWLAVPSILTVRSHGVPSRPSLPSRSASRSRMPPPA